MASQYRRPHNPRVHARTDLFEKRRALAEAWERYCDGGAEVVSFSVEVRSGES